MMRMLTRLAFAAFAFAASLPVPALSDDPPAPLDRLQRVDGTRVVPERFLRRWDPITVFFGRDVGPAAGGPADQPGAIATLDPPQAGAWAWLGPRTLQFRPAEPWQPLRRVTVITEGASVPLAPLLPAPIETAPEGNPEGFSELDRIALTFPEPVDVAALERLVSVELRPLPGISPEGGRVIKAPDLSVKPMERAARADKQTYLVTLAEPVPDGRMAIVRLTLSDEPGLDEPVFEMRVKSAVPFTIADAECGRSLSDRREDGVLRCDPGEAEAAYVEETADGAESGPAWTPGKRRALLLNFSADPENIDVVRVREALRFTPPVEDVEAKANGHRLTVSGRFNADTLYKLDIAAGVLVDKRKRPLATAFSQRFTFLPDTPSLVWDAGQGLVERLGPQMIPLRGRGYERADVRIHPIDPLSRDFWPFPGGGLETDDEAAPPLAGQEPRRWTDAADIDATGMVARIKALGSPAVSELMPLPIRRGGGDARFGLDFKSLFARIAGPEQPGTYLVGLRPVGETTRRWLRVQATDLTLSTIEETDRVRFVVTSLANTKPVSGAEIRLEGRRDNGFVPLVRGSTDTAGAFTWSIANRTPAEIARIVVVKGADTLVLEPERGPAQYARENWTKPDEAWLSWTVDPEADRAEQPKLVCHVFTERPIYRPEEPVQIKGMVRRHLGGALTYATGDGTIVVKGPSDQEWKIPVTLDQVGGFHHTFAETTPATGDYTVRFVTGSAAAENADTDEEETGEADEAESEESEEADASESASDTACGTFPFKKEAYRLPTFEALLSGRTDVPLDGPFDVDLLARYFAGGLLAERPIKWRVAQFPHVWTPPGRDGFFFSTDQRFSSETGFRSTPVLERSALTDEAGSARITLDPTIEPTAQPRRYQIEATVTGEDDLQVRAVHSVVALPPFVLGVKTSRYQPQPGAVETRILAMTADGKPHPGLDMTVRFIRRNWVSTLQASDFAQGAAKYVTETIDETLEERKLTSGTEPLPLRFEAREAGVHLVEVEASDRLGRRQSVKVDLFVGGETPVTWAQPPSETVTVEPEKDSYAPGETATLILQSPFQVARALAIVEEPDGRFRYDWLEITNGAAKYAVPVRKEQMPKLPVHFLVMRGRLSGPTPAATAPFDQGKPVTVAATEWVAVTPVKHIVTAALEYPAKARPGQEIDVTLRLSDDLGKPVSGEATFWMVDQAVLSLAREQPLDPLRHFIVQRGTRMAARDTRSMAFGVIPLEEVPGGDVAEDEWGIENVSVRRNFTPVPIYLPRVAVGSDGTAKIRVRLPDSLTVFKLRAKVIAGPDRFGHAVGEMAVRQDLVAQPALPRFVRPGDSFEAGLIARVVEGPIGNGRVVISGDGLLLEGSPERRFAFVQNRPARSDFPVSVAEPRPGRETVQISFQLQREVDKVEDKVAISLPVLPDRPPRRQREVAEIPALGKVTIKPIAEAVRNGSYARSLILAGDPTVVRLIGGLNRLYEYPYGCTEQVMAVASASLSLKPFEPVLASSGIQNRLSGDVRSAVRSIQLAIDEDGLVAFWPKARGNVSLTAWSYSFLVRARDAGEPVPPGLIERLGKVLKLALRSDYALLLSGEELRERVEALTALAEGGELEPSYLAELSRRMLALPNAALAQAVSVTTKAAGDDKRLMTGLLDALWGRVRTLSREGRPVYGGLAGEEADALILPSEARSLAEVVRAVASASPDDGRLPMLRDGLMRLGGGDGWGSTNADAAAIHALAQVWKEPATPIPLNLISPDATERVALASGTPLLRRTGDKPEAWTVENIGGTEAVALVETRWVPMEPGARATPVSQGLALSRRTYRVPGDGGAVELMTPDNDGVVQVKVGDVVEEIAELITSEDLTHVAIRLPLAAGLEPLNPALATAPAEAQPSAGPTLTPTWTSFVDDHVLYAYDRLPKGAYRFVFRTRALIPGSFTQPPGEAETMYRAGIYGASAGQRIVVSR